MSKAPWHITTARRRGRFPMICATSSRLLIFCRKSELTPLPPPGHARAPPHATNSPARCERRGGSGPSSGTGSGTCSQVPEPRVGGRLDGLRGPHRRMSPVLDGAEHPADPLLERYLRFPPQPLADPADVRPRAVGLPGTFGDV